MDRTHGERRLGVTPLQLIAHALRAACQGIALERSTGPDEISSGERSVMQNFGLECFRLGGEYERARAQRESQRPTIPAPPEDE